jgi:hypothetical protein
MSDTITPKQLAKKLIGDAEKVENAEIKKDMLESAEMIKYLVILLGKCADYIDANREYDLLPRLMIAVKDALKD